MSVPSSETDLAEARNKLRSYERDYGESIHLLTPEEARAYAETVRAESRNQSPPLSLTLLCKAVHFESIGGYLQTLRMHGAK